MGVEEAIQIYIMVRNVNSWYR